MSKKFKNKKLYRGDHMNVDRDASTARNAVKFVGAGLGILGLLKVIPWKKAGKTLSDKAKRI